jgi:hypothetical protein
MADAAADPPDGGMEEEQRLDKRLDEVPEEVGAADVGQFVGQHDFKFVRAEGLVAAESGSSTRARSAPTVTGPAMALETRSSTGRQAQCR